MLTLLIAAAAYFMGAAPWGLVIARCFCGIDPRTDGSRNTGATNVSRLCGFGWGVATLACDVLKGALPVWIALQAGLGAAGVTLVALCAVLGHVFSCFLGFKGGKAVATSIGVFLPLAFVPLLIAGLVAFWSSGAPASCPPAPSPSSPPCPSCSAPSASSSGFRSPSPCWPS